MTDKKATWATVLDVGGEGVPDNEYYPQKFKKGDIVDGDLADRAIKQKWAQKGKGERPATKGKGVAESAVDQSADLEALREEVTDLKGVVATFEERLLTFEKAAATGMSVVTPDPDPVNADPKTTTDPAKK